MSGDLAAILARVSATAADAEAEARLTRFLDGQGFAEGGHRLHGFYLSIPNRGLPRRAWDWLRAAARSRRRGRTGAER